MQAMAPVNPQITRLRHLKKSYGLTPERYDEMLDEQQGLCYVCKTLPPERQRLCIDHDHASLEVRKLLCQRCNKVLGFCDDRPELLRRLMEYLVEHGKSFEFIEQNPATQTARDAEWSKSLETLTGPIATA
jgi:hypothetical protein